MGRMAEASHHGRQGTVGGLLMTTQGTNSNPFEIIDGQVILHDEFQGVDRVVINHEQVAAIKLLLEALS